MNIIEWLNKKNSIFFNRLQEKIAKFDNQSQGKYDFHQLIKETEYEFYQSVTENSNIYQFHYMPNGLIELKYAQTIFFLYHYVTELLYFV